MLNMHVPEVLKTFGEADDVLDHISCEVSQVRKSGENAALPDLFALFLALLVFEGAAEAGGGRRREGGGGGEGGGVRGLACRLAARKDVSVHRLEKDELNQC